jgi:transposase
MTADLIELRRWLKEAGCSQVVMESTGVYWEPIYNVLEGEFEIIVGNAQHIKNVPGRKTDVKDAEWLAELLRHGLIKKSFVPNRPFRDLRVLTRYRRRLVDARSAENNRLMKVLESANIKLGCVASEVLGVSGRMMLHQIINGETDPEKLADLAKGVLRKKLDDLRLALDGRITEHHRYILRMQMERIEALDGDIAELDQRIEQKLEPYVKERDLLLTIPGVNRVIAAVIIAEVGIDMNAFPSAENLSAWAGVCPGNNITGGKRYRIGARKGNTWLKTALVEAAQAASRTKGTYLRTRYFRLASRCSSKPKAAMANAHKILRAVYFMLSRGDEYKELGDTYLDMLSKERLKHDLVRRLERIGFEVTLTPKDTNT